MPSTGASRKQRPEGIDAHEAALVSIRPSTGEIVAMVGGTNFSLENQFNRAWQAHRQPGSSFKVYVYTAAIDSGMPPTTTIDDSPVSYPMGDGTSWSPNDDDGRYMGAVTLRTALDALAQRRRGQAGRPRRARQGDRLRAPHGRHAAARAESLARARFVGGVAARSGQRVTATLANQGSTSIRRRSAS